MVQVYLRGVAGALPRTRVDVTKFVGSKPLPCCLTACPVRKMLQSLSSCPGVPQGGAGNTRTEKLVPCSVLCPTTKQSCTMGKRGEKPHTALL